MAVLDVELAEESRTRYLTYALSVVSSRALPDVRDGLKPVQRRILYAMANNLHLSPEKHHRKSAAVVGEVLARYHPHGDSACYDALVRMAQDFTLRYPLIDGQGNFGSLDGDSAAAYRYTEARMTSLAIEVIGDIGQETVSERDNFDQTVKEPVVLPSRVPNLLMNGASGIAVGMATAIPPHNLPELVKGLLLLLDNSEASESKLLGAVKGPDFPTGCLVVNTRAELKEIYATGRGPIRMQGDYIVEESGRGKSSKKLIVINSIPWGIDKSVLVERIADLIIARKVPQLVDVRDESTELVRVVLEASSGADEEKVMAYLYKNTPLQQNFNVNLTALVPSESPLTGQPERMSLKQMLLHFIDFRVRVTRAKLEYEKGKLEDRIHLLEGLASVLDAIDEVIKIVRKSDGRADAAAKLRKRFKLSERQALFIVDLRIYQLSKTSIDEVTGELTGKKKRVKEINRILKSEKALKGEVATDLKRISEEFGDARRSKIVTDYEEMEIDKEEFVEHEDVYVVVTSDGWLKRIRNTNDPSNTRLREGDSLFFVEETSTRNVLVLFTNQGNIFGTQVYDLISTTGFGEPVQKVFRFQDGEQIVAAMLLTREEGTAVNGTGQSLHALQGSFSFGEESAKRNKKQEAKKSSKQSLEPEILLYTDSGYGFRLGISQLGITKKMGKRVVRLGKGDVLGGICSVNDKLLLMVSEQGYCTCFLGTEVPLLAGSGKGVILQKLPGQDRLVAVSCVGKQSKVFVRGKDGKKREINVSAMTIGSRAKRGLKLVKRGLPVVGLA